MSWMFLRDLLSGANKYSTGIGGSGWLVFIFRLLVYMVAAEHVWKEEQKSLSAALDSPVVKMCVLTTSSPSPRSDFWALQLIMVSTPSLLVVLHVAYRG